MTAIPSPRLECSGDETSLEFCFEPRSGLVNLVRDFVSRFYEQLMVDADTSARLAIATQELLENGARYSLDGSTAMRISVAKSGGYFSVSICTRNRTGPSHLDAVREAIDAMAEVDPLAHYLVLMDRTAKRSEGSGLGLGRIRAEAEMDLRYTVSGEWITIWAEAAVQGAHS